ncbi:ribose-phosphate diphosphokinase [Sandaracinus amylolyticus]|uniref:ribose-phosphate diphosphokinase n=1 Tax=Sandaracinus amylolyticus TaxID=927083 RepID=A0A0F6YKW5_9BACT|nr:ribose-phosphate pyrophosphokinase [Sandaracinus amylolyticus]AKF07707.1 Ribose-phosphate pyrophosphokinase [Sandaracinus amylolyticus]
MSLALVVGTANPSLGGAIANALGVERHPCIAERFPDGEIRVELGGTLRGCDVFVVQPTAPPVGDSLLELVLLGDAARRAGAARTVAVLPYFGYARADRRTGEGQPLAARLVGDLIGCARFDRAITVDLHTPGVEGLLPMPVDHLSAIPTVVSALAAHAPEDAVIVAPDLGGAKRADAFARRLHRPVAVVHKTRISGRQVEAHGITGEVAGRTPILVDDMISTGSTIVASIEALRAHGCTAPAIVAATHGLLVGPARERLTSLAPAHVVLTDSVAHDASGLPEHVASIAPLLADAIRRIHERRSLADLLHAS